MFSETELILNETYTHLAHCLLKCEEADYRAVPYKGGRVSEADGEAEDLCVCASLAFECIGVRVQLASL